MSVRRSVLLLWVTGYALLLAIGCRVGIQPLVVLASFLVLGGPPGIMHVLACRHVIKRTQAGYQAFWAKIAAGGAMDLRYYLFDDRTFGDAELLRAKGELKWWLWAGVIAIGLFIPTLLAMHLMSK